jgi:catechol 2,3-dioxygenase-like lactoylglutathione lyase family enzyme
MQTGQITRRSLLLSIPVLGLRAQAGKTPIPVRSLSHMTLRVSDFKRSLEFYQGLFGLPIQARQSDTVQLRIGPGQYMAVGGTAAGGKPGIDHFCMTTPGFEVARTTAILAKHGVTKSDARGAMKTWVRMRDETPEFYLGDPDGIAVQLQDPSYCGGKGVLGNQCFAVPEPAPHKGVLAVRGLNHFTLSVSNQQRSLAFYQELFGMPVQTRQGAGAVILRVGAGPQSVALGARTGTPNIGHACLTMEGFNPDQVMKTLADYGVKPRGDTVAPAKPLTSWVRMRGEDAGGAKDGTPELYFTDPDGIMIQLQDVSYCGGSGRLGNVCK